VKEILISIYEASFTHSEVVKLTGIPDRTLHNWLQREVITLHKDFFTPGGGRRLYTPIDIFKIAVMYELTIYTQFPPSLAREMINATQHRVRARFDPEFIIEDKTNIPLGLDLIFVIGPDERPIVMHRYPGNDDPPNYGHPWLVVPVDQIIDRILDNLNDLIAKESGE